MKKIGYPEDFLWGAATASFQIEGGAKDDGRGESIWDKFCKTPGKVLNGDTGDIACDHYNRYKEDVKLIKELGLKAYRFSISWSRVFPEGKGTVNEKGLDFYNSLIDELLAAGIEPFVTLYHWDLPQKLQDIGGWDNREIIEYFVEYAETMYKSLGDKVKNWFTFNEPWCISHLGYGIGEHAPGFKDEAMAIRVSHNLNLAHAKAVKAFRAMEIKDGKIGIVLNAAPSYPFAQTIEDRNASKVFDGYFNRWFFEPCLKGEYPKDMLEIYQQALSEPTIMDGDLELICGNPVDTLGINFYTRSIVKHTNVDKVLKFEGCNPGGPVTAMGWEICPQAFYKFLTRLRTEYGNPVVYITENGAAFEDKNIEDGIVADDDRIEYLKKHFKAAYKALEDGLNLKGYFVWSLMDNFEWAYGYSKRFGIVHVDYRTLVRTPKKSALWYKDIIAGGDI